MSAKNRGSVVISQEFYPTPKYTIESILNEINISRVNSFLEPCKGNGAIYDMIDVKNKSYCELQEGINYLTSEQDNVDLILTNPPFSLAKEFITKALTESSTVIMLQRINFLGSQSRKQFWEANSPTHLFVLSTRPKFISKCNNKLCNNKLNFQISKDEVCPDCDKKLTESSDATEYAWFVWDNATNSLMKRKPGIYVL